jgi:hypothetical protein
LVGHYLLEQAPKAVESSDPPWRCLSFPEQSGKSQLRPPRALSSNPPSVRREELKSSSPSPDPSGPNSEIEKLFQRRYEARYLPPSARMPSPASRSHVDDGQEGGEAAKEAFEFRLFSSHASGHASDHRAPPNPTKIVIRSPSPADRPPGFLEPTRPRSYYFAGAPSGAERERFEASAVSGEDILAEQKRHWVRTPPPMASRVTFAKS